MLSEPYGLRNSFATWRALTFHTVITHFSFSRVNWKWHLCKEPKLPAAPIYSQKCHLMSWLYTTHYNKRFEKWPKGKEGKRRKSSVTAWVTLSCVFTAFTDGLRYPLMFVETALAESTYGHIGERGAPSFFVCVFLTANAISILFDILDTAPVKMLTIG